MIISISHHYYDHYYPFIISLTTTIITIYKLDTSTMITNIIMAYMIMIALKLVRDNGDNSGTIITICLIHSSPSRT